MTGGNKDQRKSVNFNLDQVKQVEKCPVALLTYLKLVYKDLYDESKVLGWAM